MFKIVVVFDVASRYTGLMIKQMKPTVTQFCIFTLCSLSWIPSILQAQNNTAPFAPPTPALRATPIEDNTPIVRARPVRPNVDFNLQAPTDKRLSDFVAQVRGVISPQLNIIQTNALVVALDDDSPASFVERLQLAAMALYEARNERAQANRGADANETVNFLASDFCPIYQVLTSKQRGAYQNLDREIALQLMRGDRNSRGNPNANCGEGYLTNVRVTPNPAKAGEFNIQMNLKKDIVVRSSNLSLATNNRRLAYTSSLKADSDMIIKRVGEVKLSQILNQKLNSSFKKSALGFDVMAGLDALMDAMDNESQTIVTEKMLNGSTRQVANNFVQARRVLSNYSIYSFSPETPDSGIVLGSGWQARSFIGTEFIMHAPAISKNKDSLGYRKAVLSIRPIVQENRGQFATIDIEVEFGESRLFPELSVDPQWQPVIDHTLEAVSLAIEKHVNGLSQTGIGSMYGPKSSYALMNDKQKLDYINKSKKPGTLPEMPKETSCIGFVQNFLRTGYSLSGMGERYKEIDKRLAWSNGQGTHLLAELQKDGWKLLLWAPDARNPTTRVQNPSKDTAHHTWAYGMAKQGKGYMKGVLSYGHVFEGLKIDYVVSDYRPTLPAINSEDAKTNHAAPTKTKTLRNLDADELLQRIPFFVGVANGGYHVYLGSKGMVIESHSTRGPTDNTNIEFRPLNQFGLFKNESYLTGVIAVPPGVWEESITENILVPPTLTTP